MSSAHFQLRGTVVINVKTNVEVWLLMHRLSNSLPVTFCAVAQLRKLPTVIDLDFEKPFNSSILQDHTVKIAASVCSAQNHSAKC